MQPVLISVIIPVYNAERFLRKAVQSALDQPQTGEVILVEDASPDNALTICEALVREYPDKVRLFTHPGHQNLGAGPSRNLGIWQARHEYIAFLDADDYYLPGRFSKEEELFRDESVDGVYGALGVHYYSEAARKTFLEKGMNERVALSEVVRPEELIDVLIGMHGRVRGYFHGNCLTVRKRIFEKTGYFSDIRISQDTHMWIRMAMVGKLVAGQLHEPVSVRGVHEENRVTRANLYHYKHILFSSLLEWAKERPVPRRVLTYLDAHRRCGRIVSQPTSLSGFWYLARSLWKNGALLRATFFNPSVKRVFGANHLSHAIIRTKEKANLLLLGRIV